MMNLISKIFLVFLLSIAFAGQAAPKKKLTKEEYERRRWNKILRLIDTEMATINKARSKSVKLQYRLFELYSEKVKLYKEKENKKFVELKLKYGKKIKRKDIFKKTTELYNTAHKYGATILRRYPNTRYKAAIYYTLALNSRDFAYDKRDLNYLRLAIDNSNGQENVNYLARTSLAEYYYNNKNWKSAIYQYKLVIDNKDDEWYSKNLLNYGWCLLKTHEFDGAINNLEKSFKLSSDDFYVNVQDQAMTGLISFYVLGKQIDRGIAFINKYQIPKEKNESLLKLAQKSAGKGFYAEAQKIVLSLEKTVDHIKEVELYADLRLFQFDLYNQYHKSDKLLNIAKILAQTKMSEYQQEEAVRKISDVVGAKQVILKKDFSKYDKEYNQSILTHIISYFDILSIINTKEKAQYEYYQAETYYSVHKFKDALRTYKKSIATYEKNPANEDLRHKNLDAVFSCIDNIKMNKKENSIELEYAFTKYLSYWPKDKKAQKIYPRLYGLYLDRDDYVNAQNSLEHYIKFFKKDKNKQQDLFKIQLDKMIKQEKTELLAGKINLMRKGFLSFDKKEIVQSETILASILFKQLQKLKEDGQNKEAIAGYQKIFFTNYYPKIIKGEAAFNMGMLYTDLEDNNNALKWYKKSFKYFNKKQAKEKRDFLEKMALRTSLLHNFLNAARLNKFILVLFCKEKDKNEQIFVNSIKNDLANNYTTRAQHTLKTYKVCVEKIPENLLNTMLVHFYNNDQESTLNGFINDYKLEKVFPQLISRYYEHYFWKYFESDPRRRVEYQSKLSRMKTDSSQILLLGLKQLDGLREDIKAFLPKRIAVTQTNPDPNKFINELTSRINKIQGLNQIAGSIFQTGHGQISVMVYDELIKLTQSFDSEVNSYTIPIPDEIFQKQFKAEMFKISQNLKNEIVNLQKNSQELIEKYELLVDFREESDRSKEVLNISNIRMPASENAISLELVN